MREKQHGNKYKYRQKIVPWMRKKSQLAINKNTIKEIVPWMREKSSLLMNKITSKEIVSWTVQGIVCAHAHIVQKKVIQNFKSKESYPKCTQSAQAAALLRSGNW